MSERLMDGFPPRPDMQVSLANWRSSPFNKWVFHHVRELLPSADIPHDPANVRALPVSPIAVDGLRIPRDNGEILTLGQVLEATSTDGLVVLHKGRIALEHYANGMTLAAHPHVRIKVDAGACGGHSRRRRTSFPS